MMMFMPGRVHDEILLLVADVGVEGWRVVNDHEPGDDKEHCQSTLTVEHRLPPMGFRRQASGGHGEHCSERQACGQRRRLLSGVSAGREGIGTNILALK